MNIMNKFTIRTLKMNKVRTLITIIGIILSVSMLTAVTTFISSMQQFSINHAISVDGSWHGVLYGMNKEELNTLLTDEEVVEAGIGQYIGYAFGNTVNEYKPYIYIYGLGEGFRDLLPVKLLEGRFPDTGEEIILPKHLIYNGGVEVQLGDEISLEIGDRYTEGEVLYQQTPFLKEETTDGIESSDSIILEELKIRERKSYKVVGFYERPTFEGHSAPGYTALTVADNDSNGIYDSYIRVKKPKNIYTYVEKYEGKGASFNSDYLRYLNASNNDSFNKTLYSLGAILIVIIMFGSISLIYNAFSISVSERMKQFGLLSSIGGTKRQIIKSVLFEAIVLSGIGIPLGILSGIGGIGVTLKLTEGLFLRILGTDVAIGLSVSWAAVVIAGIVGFITVLISAYIPARKAGAVSAIEAIRQNKNIFIKNRKIKTSPMVYKLFGLEGMIASKNFKRNKKKYKATVISLFMSVVLFISASSFCAYLAKGTGTAVGDVDYELFYHFNTNNSSGVSLTETADIINEVEGVTKLAYGQNVFRSLGVREEDMSKKYLDYINKEYGLESDEDGLFWLGGTIYFVDDTTFYEYSKEIGYSSLESEETPAPILIDRIKYYAYEEGKYYTYSIFDGKKPEINVVKEKKVEEGYKKAGYRQEEDSTQIYQFVNENGDMKEYPVNELEYKAAITPAASSEKLPFGMSSYLPSILMILPLSQLSEYVNPQEGENYNMYMKAANHKEVYKELYKALEERGLAPYTLHDAMESTENSRAMITVIRIFSYGFITLISLIAAANVFNTITTNISLRRVEFAMLKSTGMTKKGFKKMMNYECLLYGIKSLFYGIPVSILLTYLIYKGIGFGVDMEFFLPWESIVIAVGSVFLVVFSTMIYAMNKISKENTIDTLKNENI